MSRTHFVRFLLNLFCVVYTWTIKPNFFPYYEISESMGPWLFTSRKLGIKVDTRSNHVRYPCFFKSSLFHFNFSFLWKIVLWAMICQEIHVIKKFLFLVSRNVKTLPLKSKFIEKNVHNKSKYEQD